MKKCPHCGYSLVPVSVIESGKRRPAYLTCPGPTCDYIDDLQADAKDVAAAREEPRVA